MQKVDLHAKSFEWINRFIELVKPEIIICEGKWAFETLTKKILNCPENWFEGYGYSSTVEIPHIIGYKRNSFGHILQKELVANKIKELVYVI